MRAAGFLVIALALPAAAQEPSVAAQFFRAGEAAHAKGDFAAAARSFEEAYRHAPHAAAMFNAAHEWEAAGEKARAADDYAVAASRGELGAEKAQEARARVTELERSMAVVHVDAPSGATVWLAHAEGVPAPLSVHVAPGAYTARVRFADGSSETRELRAHTGESPRLTFEAPPASTRPSPQRTIGWISLGVSAALGVTAIVLGTQAVAARDALESSGETSVPAHDEAVSYRLWTNVALAAAGAFAITGVVLILSAPKEDGARVGLRVSPTGAHIGGRF